MNQAIKIDLSTFFDDERRFCCIFVDPTWKFISCLQKRLEFLFDIHSVRILSDGCFLPPQEPIEILSYCTDFKAFVPTEALELKKKKKSKKYKKIEESEAEYLKEEIAFAECENQKLNDKKKKRRHVSVENSNLTDNLENKSKRSKNSNKNQILEPLEFLHNGIENEISKANQLRNSISTSESEEPTMKNQSKSETVKNISKENATDARTYDVGHMECRTSTTEEKKKSTEAENNVDKILTALPSSTFLHESNMLNQSYNAHNFSTTSNTKNPFKKSKSSKAHIYFNETGDILRSTNNENTKAKQKKDKISKSVVIFRCPLINITNSTEPQKPRIFHLKAINIAKQSSNKEMVEIQEEILLPPYNVQNVLSVDNRKITTEQQKDNHEDEKIKETNKESLNEKMSPNTATVTTGNISTVKSEQNQIGGKNLEILNANNTLMDSKLLMDQTNLGKTNVDCVDLSIDLEEDIMETEQKVKLDKTANDESNSRSSTSDIEEISDIIDLNETDDNYNSTVNTTSKHNTSIRIDKILPFSKNLRDLPNIEDIVIFKVSYQNKHYKNCNSNFIAGKVQYINKRTKLIKMLIMDGIKELCHLPNQFLCNLDESQDGIHHVQLKLNDMIEPKVFSIS